MREFDCPGGKPRPHCNADGHGPADELMCEVLTELGYGEGIEVFNKMLKYYD
ncbi:hypothetical protein [Synergistes jonesii]|nr:hypothetical protein [Synergistes jonesii]